MGESNGPLIVTSKVKELLKGAPGVKTISGEALAWVDARTREAVDACGATGKKTPSGRLMPPEGLPGSTGLVYKDRLKLDKEPERLCARGKEALAEAGGDKPARKCAVVEILGGQVTSTATVGGAEVIVLDRTWVERSLGIPECGTQLSVLCSDLRYFAELQKLSTYAELADEIEHKHAKLLAELGHATKKEKKKEPSK